MTDEMRETSRTSLRFALIGGVALAMLIPLAMVDGVTAERQSYFDAALADVAGAWGPAQTLGGPFLIVPEEHVMVVRTDEDRTVRRTVVRERVYLPETLSLDLAVEHQFRHRATYEVPVYTASARYAGSFPAIDVDRDEDVRVLADRARLVVGVSHTQAIADASGVSFGRAGTGFRAGTGHPWVGPGIQAELPGYDGGAAPFDFELTLKGTHRLGFTPVGGSSEVRLRSSWPHPSFDGQYLPEHYRIDGDGFEATWKVHELARSLPDSFIADADALASNIASVSLHQPVTEYRVVDRAIKYGLLFVALTFLGFVCFELTLPVRFHPVQYGVVGVGLVLFYLALLSLSEHLPFALAYGTATLALTALVSGYVRAMTRSTRVTGWMAVIVVGLYATLYVLLELEAFALLVGTGVLFLGLVALMFSTRHLGGGGHLGAGRYPGSGRQTELGEGASADLLR